MTTWQRNGKYYETNGRYNVSAARVQGRWRFVAWRNPSAQERIRRLVEGINEKPTAECIGCFNTAAEARSACERDAA